MTMKLAVGCVLLWCGVSSADDFYELHFEHSRCLKVTAAGVVAKSCGNTPNERWVMTPDSGGYVKLSTAVDKNLCLDIVNDGTNETLQMAKCARVSGQGWRVERREHGAKIKSQWRGDDYCLAVEQGVARVQACTEGGNSWDLVAIQTTSDGNSADSAYDGEVPSNTDTRYDHVFQFDDTCKVDIPGEPASALRVFRCHRKDADMICTVRSPTSMDKMFTTVPGMKTLRAPITVDSAKSVSFATPAKKFQFSGDVKSGTAILALADGSKCKGKYYAHDEWSGMAAKYRERHPVEDNESRSRANRGDRPEPAPTTSKPTGSERGRMCGKPSDCQSGVCKMENKTRGRCQ